MIRSFFKHSLVYISGNLITRGIGVALIPIYTRYISPNDYGIIDLFVVVSSIVNLTISLEITQAIARYYPNSKTDQEKVEYTSTAFLFTLFMYILYISVSLIFSDYFTILLLNDLKYKHIFLLSIFSIATNGMFYFTQNQLKWQMQPKESVVVSIVNMSVSACVSIFFLLIVRLKVESIFIGQIVGNSIASLVGIYFAKDNYRLVFSIGKLKKMLSFSFPLVFSGIAVFVATMIDRIAIKGLLGFKDLGIYGVAYRFASIAGLIMIGFQNSLMPLIYKNYKEKKTPENISKIFNIFNALALSLISGSFLFSNEIVMIMTTDVYHKASSLIPLLVMVILFSNIYLFSPGLVIAKKTKTIAIINIIGAILNTVLNYTMIPIFGVKGAAGATLISVVVVSLFYSILSFRYYKIPYKIKSLLISYGFTITSIYVIKNLLTYVSLKTFAIKTLFIICISFFLYYLLIKKDG